jgi:hypothetical protein
MQTSKLEKPALLWLYSAFFVSYGEGATAPLRELGC